jgi:hypothetical protein
VEGVRDLRRDVLKFLEPLATATKFLKPLDKNTSADSEAIYWVVPPTAREPGNSNNTPKLPGYHNIKISSLLAFKDLQASYYNEWLKLQSGLPALLTYSSYLTSCLAQPHDNNDGYSGSDGC